MELSINPSRIIVPLDEETHEPVEPRRLMLQEFTQVGNVMLPGVTVIVGPFEPERWAGVLEYLNDPKAAYEAAAASEAARSKIVMPGQGGPR